MGDLRGPRLWWRGADWWERTNARTRCHWVSTPPSIRVSRHRWKSQLSVHLLLYGPHVQWWTILRLRSIWHETEHIRHPQEPST
ncbi:hypothetical protein BT69DRAFT_130492 [Atractiella rhizophila]|nr:hypothetical protein BT69DRAFT_130492 [Atractiella rhizophila]